MDTRSSLLTIQKSCIDESCLENETEQGNEETLIVEDSNPLWKLYETIRTYTDNDGVCLSQYFSEVPSIPDELMEGTENCLSMFLIRKRLVNGFYDYVSEIAEDFNTLWENVKKVNESDSNLYKYAIELQEVMQKKVQELIGFQFGDLESDLESELEKEDDSDDDSSKCLNTSDPLKERLQSLCKCLLEYTTEDGIQPIFQFMETPSKETCKDYYERIQKPIDMLTIEENMRTDKYTSEEELINDLRLMFCNCREYYGEESSFYKHTITLEKVLIDHARALGVATEKFPVITNTIKVEAPDTFVDVSNDSNTSVKNTLGNTSANLTTISTTGTRRRCKDKMKRKTINGYILFSSVSRRTVRANNPTNLSFGDISRIVGSEWKNLPIRERCLWEKKAERLNEKNEAAAAKIDPLSLEPKVTRTHTPSVRSNNKLWECQWDNCNRVFKSRLDCLDHSISSDRGHVPSSFKSKFEGKYECRWNKCPRIGKGSPPFPSLHRLIRHVKDVHLLKGQCSDPLSTDGPGNPFITDPLSFSQYSEISDPLTRRLYSWCKLLLDIKTRGGRQPMLPFIGEPSADSYEQFHGPKNMWAVYRNISANKYSSEKELLYDFKLMFRNYRENNPNDLSTCKDATILERILVDRARMLGVPLVEMPFISKLVKVVGPTNHVENSNMNSNDIGISGTSNMNPASMVMKVDPLSTSNTEHVDCKDFMKLQPSNTFGEHYPPSGEVRVLRTSNNDVANVAIKVDPLSLSNTESIDSKSFIKMEIPSMLDEVSNSGLTKVEISRTTNCDIKNVVVDPSFSLLTGDTEPVNDCKTLIKIEKTNAFDEDLSTTSSDVGIPRPSNSDITNMITDQSFSSIDCKNFTEVETIDLLEDDSSMQASDFETPTTLIDGSASLITKTQKVTYEQLNRKPFNGYILYSRETRKTVSLNNPQMSFGEISRLMGAQWMKLSAQEKKAWGDEAIRISKEGVERRVVETQRDETASGKLYWECLWSNCDNVFENQLDCMDHATADHTGHVNSWFMDSTNSDNYQYRKDRTYQCQWGDCPRLKKGAPPFFSLNRLIRHVREVHILKSPGRRLLFSNQLAEKSLRNYVPNSSNVRNSFSDNSNHSLVKDSPDQEEEEIILLD